MNRGESDCFTSDSNKFNLSRLPVTRQRADPDINSARFIGVVENLPI
jgi:hypothetical protein